MAGNLIIVAIPDENDRVWKVSSEKVPHLTLLFLGEDVDTVSNLDQIILFVEHAANISLRRFYLPVDRRGELGDAKADVLFFKKDRYDFKAVREFRATLLQDPNIRKAYDASSQFEAPDYVGAPGQPWIPHLTLGYPESPAKPLPNDQTSTLYEVRFNRIAVWTGDFEGPEFLLKDYWEDFDMGDIPMNVAMSELEHHGVKGMRWGVRKEEVTSGAQAVGRAAKSTGGTVGKAAKAVGRFAGDVQFEAQTHRRTDEYGGEERASQADLRVMGAAAKPFREKDLPALKARHPNAATKKQRILKPLSKEARAYREDAKRTYIQRLETTANSMKNVSGTREYTIRERGGDLPTSKYYWEVSTREARHAAGDGSYLLDVILDDEGLITDLRKVEPAQAIAQTMDLGMEFLEHYGVKGMRWGVRNEKGGSNTSGVGEKKKTEWGRLFDPQGHDLGTDIFKAVVWPLVPPLGLFAIPADVRLARGAARGVKAKAININEKRFEKHAQSHKNFEKIHKAAGERIDSEIPQLNEKYGGDLTKDPKKQKTYDNAVQKMLQDSYREAAQSIGNKPDTMHLDLEFKNDGMDFAIKARQGAATPLSDRVRHADEDASETVELNYTGKVLRDPTGHFKGLKFDDPSQDPAVQHLLDLGEGFLLHYGVKGMHWGIRRDRPSPTAVAVEANSKVPRGKYRKTQVQATGGENHPAHEDALKVAKAKAKLRKSGTEALSNKELQELQTRLNLERNVTTLVRDSTRVGKGRKFVRNLTGVNQEVNTAATTGLNTVEITRRVRNQFA